MVPMVLRSRQAEAQQYLLPGVIEKPVTGTAGEAVGLGDLFGPAANEDAPPRQRTYHVRCQTSLHEAVQAACRRAHLSPAQMVRAALAVLPPDRLDDLADPGAPKPRDAQRIAGRLETPVIRLRLPAGLTAGLIRKVLGYVADMASGRHELVPAGQRDRLEKRLAEAEATCSHQREALTALAGELIEGGVATRDHALHVLRFPPESEPTPDQVTARFRGLAAVLHPDAGLLDQHRHMAQLLDARRRLMLSR